jgi:hypothetical protein
MALIHRIANGLVISYESSGKKLPSTQELLSSLEPAPFADQLRDIIAQKTTTKKIEIRGGDQTPQFSMERSPFQIPEISKRFTRMRGGSDHNCGRKHRNHIKFLHHAG